MIANLIVNETQPHMTNSHLLVQEFDYYEPASVAEAAALLEKPRTMAMAGGTHLLVMMKMERDTPSGLVNISKIPGMRALSLNDQGELVIGACASIRTIYNHPLVRARYPALVQAAGAFGSTQIQVMATLGGNICNGSPASDTVPALFIYNARLILESRQGQRELPIDQFLLGPGRTALRSGELLVSVTLPSPPPGARSAYTKVARVAADLAKVSLALLLVPDGEGLKECRMAFGSLAPTVVRACPAEEFLVGSKEPTLAAGNLACAGELAAACVSPIDDARSNAWYRRRLASVMLQDAVTDLLTSPIRGGQGEVPSGNGRGKGFLPSPIRGGQGEVLTRRVKGELTQITLTVNGIPRRVWVAPNELLLNVLRERLQLTGTKYGCGLGECSACTIHLDGQPALACLVLAVAADGHTVTTIEGLQAADGTLDPLQQAFIDEAAFQCGYCTPGILMTVKGLLNETPQPDEDAVRDYLKGNRCRCTGYISIVRAVMAAGSPPPVSGPAQESDLLPVSPEEDGHAR